MTLQCPVLTVSHFICFERTRRAFCPGPKAFSFSPSAKKSGLPARRTSVDFTPMYYKMVWKKWVIIEFWNCKRDSVKHKKKERKKERKKDRSKKCSIDCILNGEGNAKMAIWMDYWNIHIYNRQHSFYCIKLRKTNFFN